MVKTCSKVEKPSLKLGIKNNLIGTKDIWNNFSFNVIILLKNLRII